MFLGSENPTTEMRVAISSGLLVAWKNEAPYRVTDLVHDAVQSTGRLNLYLSIPMISPSKSALR